MRYTYDPDKHWYVLRASYGRVDKGYDYIVEDGTYAYVAKKYVEKTVGGHRKIILQALIPNLLFVYTTKEKAEFYVKTAPPTSSPFLSFYYNHFELNESQHNPPLIIPMKQMESFVRATSSHDRHLLFLTHEKCRFKTGETVRVVEGTFQGVEGRVARVSGQQRVIIVLDQIGCISTAYVPTAFLERIK